MTKKTVKKSLLVGALTSSFGVFVSKALGLLYFSPLSALAGESNMTFYSITYTYYDLLLKISSAGIPFAIAALVARYTAKDDYKMVLLVKKLGTSIALALSFVVAIVFFLISPALAANSMGGSYASGEDVANLLVLFRILLLAVILVPYLSALRGYYQGLKRLDLYASSQALEQFVRVFCILAFGYLAVRIFKFNSIFAIFVAILAAGIAALMTIIFLKFMARNDDAYVLTMAKKQEEVQVDIKELIKEIFFLGIPYLTISFLGSLAPLINTTFYLPLATSLGVDYEIAKLSLGILQANCAKLAAIPMVLTLGFSSGLVPYLVESLEKKNYDLLSKQMTQVIEALFYILIPVIFIFTFFAKDIYFIMYGNRNLELGASLFMWNNLMVFTDTIAPILSSMMITLKMRKQTIITLIVGFVVKCLSFYPFVMMFDAYGLVLSTALSSAVVIVIYLYVLDTLYNIRFMRLIKKAGQMMIASTVMIVPPLLIHQLTGFAYTSRILDIIIMSLLGLMMVIIYYLATVFFKLPQKIFGIKELSVKSLLRRFRS